MSEGADGSQVVLHNAGQVHHKPQGLLCYDNKESSVIYDMASIIDDKSVADQVVQRVVRYCVLQHGWGSDVLRCSISLSYSLK